MSDQDTHVVQQETFQFVQLMKMVSIYINSILDHVTLN